MSLLDCNFFSQTLKLNIAMTIILPEGPIAGCPVLYLLHGRSDDHTTWQRRTALERYLDGRRLLVIMPNVHRSYYTNMAHGGCYWDFISEEVPERVQQWFSPATDRSCTFVAGLSMGGYGAFKLALTYPERFAAAASLSGALNVARRDFSTEPNEALAEWRGIFGDLAQLPGSANDLFSLAEQVTRHGVRPSLFQACGQQDYLYQENLCFRDHAKKLGLDLRYTEGPGDHNWSYWDTLIQQVLDWLPLN